MLDSGSAGNFIHPTEVMRLGLAPLPREQPLVVTHVLGGKVGQVTQQVKCIINIGDHLEEITLDVVPIGKHAVILGLPWLRVHQPYIAWRENTVTFLSEYCKENCKGDSSTLHYTSHTQAELAKLEPMEINMVTNKEQDTIPHDYHDFLDVFDAESARKYPNTRGEYDFKIDLVEGAVLPKPAKPYRLTPGQQEEVKKQLQELEEAGMIESSDSPLAAPLFFVPKKDGTQRMCIDYRKLNEITIRDAYPLPNMEQLLEVARGAMVFSKFDLRSAYNMFPIRKEDRWKTGFVTPWGLKQFTVMHYGFVNAPACLQRYMDNILNPLITRQPLQVSAYMDDTGSFAKSLEEAIKVNQEILAIFRKHKLYCKASKCEFHKDQMELLGVTISGDGLGMEEKKVTAIRDWPVPTNLKEMKGFIGFCNFYRRFLKNFALIV